MLARHCLCSTCSRTILPYLPVPRTTLVSTLYVLSNEFGALAEDMDAERGTRTIAVADALVMLAQKAERYGDDAVLDDIEAVLDERDITPLLVPTRTPDGLSIDAAMAYEGMLVEGK